jgi:hypothetical protein
MFLMAHRFLRGTVLGLMFFLAGAAACSCDSYDPDPYDDIPPVVTVEFNYVVPSRINIRPSSTQTKNRQQAVTSSQVSRVITVNALALAHPVVSVPGQSLAHLVMPLRC